MLRDKNTLILIVVTFAAEKFKQTYFQKLNALNLNSNEKVIYFDVVCDGVLRNVVGTKY